MSSVKYEEDIDLKSERPVDPSVSGVKKYSRKHNIGASSGSSRKPSGSSAKKKSSGARGGSSSSNKNSGSSKVKQGTKLIGQRSSGSKAPVSVRSSASNVKRATEKNKTAAEKRNGRFSTHGKALIIVIFIVIFILISVFSAFLSYTYLVDRYENPILADEIDLDPDTTVKFKIEKGSGTKEISADLKSMGLIKNQFLFKLLSKFNGYDSSYKSGVHYLSKGLTYDEIMVLLSSEPETVKVTFPEGFTSLQIAERLAANNICDKEAFLEALNTTDVSSYSFISGIKSHRDYYLDGYIFPDTYEFEIDSSPETVIYKMLNRFNDIFKPEYYERIEKNGLSVDDVVTIASFVERDVTLAYERETMAGLYRNRLKGDFYYGYPPGPCCSPGEASITAVIKMNGNDYLYFTLRSDESGAHDFFATYEEYEAATREETS